MRRALYPCGSPKTQKAPPRFRDASFGAAFALLPRHKVLCLDNVAGRCFRPPAGTCSTSPVLMFGPTSPYWFGPLLPLVRPINRLVLIVFLERFNVLLKSASIFTLSFQF